MSFLELPPGARPVLLVGLTGGIATGKSTVSGMLREFGVPVVDADAIVHRLLEASGAAVEPIAAEFGFGVRLPAGGIDRRALAEIVFRDEAARKRLESIVHPMVAAESRDRVREAIEAGGVDVVAYDAALIVETGRQAQFHRLLVVVTAPEVQLQRLMERDGLSPDDAGARIRAQMPLSRKVEVADYVVDNSGPWHDTRRQVAEVHSMLKEDARLLRTKRPLPIRRVS